MRNVPIPLVTGFYRDEAHPWSMQDVWNYMPCKAERGSTRSPLMLKTPPGLFPWLEVPDAPPVRGIHDMEGRLFAVIGRTLYRLNTSGVAVPIGTIPGNGRVQMDHNQISGGNQLLVANGSAAYVYDSVLDTLERVTDPGYAASYLASFMDGYMLGIDRAGRFAFNSAPADAMDYNTLNRWTSEYKPDRLVSMGRLGGDLLLLSANSGEFFTNSGEYPQPFRSKRIFLDKGCAGPFTVAEADSTVFWLGSDGFFYQLEGYAAKRISTRPVEQAIRGQDWWNAFAFVWESEGHTCVGWTFLNGQTWLWDCSQQEWHRRESYGFDRWRVNCTTKSNGQWYAGDFQKGRVWRIDWDYPWEGQAEFVSGFTQPVIADDQHELIHNRLEIVLDVGQPEVAAVEFPLQPIGPSITGDAPDGIIGTAYSGYAYTITGGDASIVSVAVVSGALPSGIALSNAGVLSAGTLTAYGLFSYRIRVTDANGLYAELNDSISIAKSILALGASVTPEQPSASYWNGDGWTSIPKANMTATRAATHGPDGWLVVWSTNSWFAGAIGTTWATRTGVGFAPESVGYGGGVVFAAQQNANAKRSTDFGNSWSSVTWPNNTTANCVVFGNDLWIVGVDGTVNGPYRQSVDGGITWTQGSSAAMPYAVRDVYYDAENEDWYLCGGTSTPADAGLIKRTKNWSSFTTLVSDAPSRVESMAFGADGRAVAVTAHGEIMFTTDSWATYGTSAMTVEQSSGTRQVVFDGIFFYVSDNNGNAANRSFRSEDGNTWDTEKTMPQDGNVCLYSE